MIELKTDEQIAESYSNSCMEALRNNRDEFKSMTEDYLFWDNGIVIIKDYIVGALKERETEINQLKEEKDRQIKTVEHLLAHCKDAECEICSKIVCQHKDEMHFHHDGCPSCVGYEQLMDEIKQLRLQLSNPIKPNAFKCPKCNYYSETFALGALCPSCNILLQPITWKEREIMLLNHLVEARKQNQELQKDKESSVDKYIQQVKAELKQISKGEYNTWGFVQMFFDILDKNRQAIDAARKEQK